MLFVRFEMNEMVKSAEQQWMQRWIVALNGCLVLGWCQVDMARHGQDVRNSGHYKTINRWKQPNYSDNKWENETSRLLSTVCKNCSKKSLGRKLEYKFCPKWLVLWAIEHHGIMTWRLVMRLFLMRVSSHCFAIWSFGTSFVSFMLVKQNMKMRNKRSSKFTNHC